MLVAHASPSTNEKKMKFLAKNHHKNAIPFSLIQEKPQSLLDNAYILLPKVRLHIGNACFSMSLERSHS